MGTFNALFSPLKIGNLCLKNRIVMAAMGTNFGREDGMVTDRAIDYYVERAKGGVGLIITESSPTSKLGRHRVRCLGAFDDSFIPGLRRLVDAVHKHNTAIALQLLHAGRNTSPDITGSPILAPSPIPRFQGAPVPKEMSLQEIRQTIGHFGDMARRAKEAGFDAVEIHGAHGYLINQFLSPRLNKRSDVYGGSRENRGRLAVEVIQHVRSVVGGSFPIIFRLSVRELVEGGYELEDGLFWAKEIEKAGSDIINVTGGSGESYHTLVQFISPMSFPEGAFVPLSEEVKKVVSIPVMVVNRMNNPAFSERVLQEGKADLIAVARNFLTDPYWPAKARTGEEDRIRPCVACNLCIWSLQKSNGDVTCCQNASLGYEADNHIDPAKTRKKIVVVGGGPGGMEAARVAGKRRHRVILFEKENQLGGQFLLAAAPPHKKILEKPIQWLISELQHEGVEVRLATEATSEAIEKEKPDGVIVASGAFPIVPKAFAGPNVVTAQDVLGGKDTGKRVMVLGGGLIGTETAEYLCEKGCQVTLVEMQDDLAKDMEGTTRLLLIKRLSEAGVSVMLSAVVKEVREGGALVEQNGQERWLEAETIVLALGCQPNRSILTGLKGKPFEIISIGDCVQPRNLKEAIHEGFRAGFKICS